MAVNEQEQPSGAERMIQGRLWSRRLPPIEVPREVAAERDDWWRQLHPGLFDPRRYAGRPVPGHVGKGCMVCLIDTHDTTLQHCPRCRRRLLWVSFESLPY